MTTPRLSAPSNQSPASRASFGIPGAGQSWGNFGLGGALTGLLAIVALVGGLIWSAATGQAPPAQRPRIFGGSLVLDDYRPLAVVDVATGAVTVQLEGVYQQVGAASYFDVQAVPTTAGTMLVNRVSGNFNMLGKDNYVLGPPSGGISLGPLTGARAAAGFSDGASTFVVRYAPDSAVSLVDASTVEAGAKAQAEHSSHPVRPLGFARLGGPASTSAGAAVVAAGSLWSLVGGPSGCRLLEISPSPRAPQGLAVRVRAHLGRRCQDAALERAGASVGLARPGRLEVFSGRSQHVVDLPGTAGATALLPVRGATTQLYYLARQGGAWYLVSAPPGGTGAATVPRRLEHFGAGSLPAVPALSGGALYTLDQAQPGQPTLWTVSATTAVMAPVRGAATYPAKSPTEKASFKGAQVLVDGPRVVFNNPESLLAVIVFTDGSHRPVVVDKSTAVVVSAAGPGDVNVKRPHRHQHKRSRTSHSNPVTTTTPTTVAQPLSQPLPQPVTPQVNCATTTEKPYEPEIASVAPSDEAALVTWAYHLLSEQDCLPTTWSVAVTALGGAPQPARPVQVVNGQQQLLVTGLRPDTSYRTVVTAYINRQATASMPWNFTTTAVGPAAPAGVNAQPDGRGGWTVSWSPCRGPQCTVPAATWRVIGTACGSSVTAAPPQETVTGRRTSVVLDGSPAGTWLGTSMSFSVQGVSSAGLSGAPKSSGNCTTAWQPPDPAELQLQAAAVPAGAGLTAQLDVQVVNGATPLLAFGGTTVQYTYTVGNLQVGPTTASQVLVPGLSAAHQYQAAVTVVPLGHPEALITLTSAPFSRTLPWPAALALQVTGSVSANPNDGTVVATVQGLPSGNFDAVGNVTCASEAQPFNTAVVGSQFEVPLALDQMGGRCTLSASLSDRAQPDPYGVASPPLSAAFAIGTAPSYSFAAVASDACSPDCATMQLVVSYNGPGDQPAGTNWRVSAVSADGCRASSPTSSAAQFPVTLGWPMHCQVPAITVDWLYLGQPGSAPADLPGLPPPSTAPPSTAPPSTAPASTAPPSTTAPPPPPTTRPTTTAAPPTTLPPTTLVPTTLPPTTLAPTTLPPAPTTTSCNLPQSCNTTTTVATATTATTTTTVATTTTTVAATTTTTVAATTTTTAVPSTTSTTTPATTTTTAVPSTTSTTTPTTTASTTGTTATGAAAAGPALCNPHCFGLAGSVGPLRQPLIAMAGPVGAPGDSTTALAWYLLGAMLAGTVSGSWAWCRRARNARTRRAR